MLSAWPAGKPGGSATTTWAGPAARIGSSPPGRGHLRLPLRDAQALGVDVVSRAHIFGPPRGLAAHGTAVLCASNDYAQLAELCGRVLIFAGGQLRAALTGPDLTKQAILTQCLLLSGEARRAEP